MRDRLYIIRQRLARGWQDVDVERSKNMRLLEKTILNIRTANEQENGCICICVELGEHSFDNPYFQYSI